MPIKHPDPKDTTKRNVLIKAGTACSYNGCSEPLIDAEHGILVADVCHIKAQSQGGPRFDENQSPEDNASASNLIALCKKHAYIVDKAHVDAYPTERLVEMKKNQEDMIEKIADKSWIRPANAFSGPLHLDDGTIVSAQVHFWQDRNDQMQIYTDRQLAISRKVQSLYSDITALAQLQKVVEENPNSPCRDTVQFGMRTERHGASPIEHILQSMLEIPDITFAEFAGYLVVGNDPSPAIDFHAERFEETVRQTSAVYIDEQNDDAADA